VTWSRGLLALASIKGSGRFGERFLACQEHAGQHVVHGPRGAEWCQDLDRSFPYHRARRKLGRRLISEKSRRTPILNPHSRLIELVRALMDLAPEASP
jgi:hypothetical protein